MGIRFALDSKRMTALQSVHVINVDACNWFLLLFQRAEASLEWRKNKHHWILWKEFLDVLSGQCVLVSRLALVSLRGVPQVYYRCTTGGYLPPPPFMILLVHLKVTNARFIQYSYGVSWMIFPNAFYGLLSKQIYTPRPSRLIESLSTQSQCDIV